MTSAIEKSISEFQKYWKVFVEIVVSGQGLWILFMLLAFDMRTHPAYEYA